MPVFPCTVRPTPVPMSDPPATLGEVMVVHRFHSPYCPYSY
jgi:hypothetical protein